VVTHRYQAIVSYEGWADVLALTLHFPSSHRRDVLFGGSVQDVPENYLKNSPLQHAAGATTPILFFMGNPEKGGANECQNVWNFYKILQDLGVETDYVNYSDEGHVIEQPRNQRDLLEKTMKWLDEHTKVRT